MLLHIWSFLHIHNLTMDPPPKKQHLTRQFLMEMARKEGIIWEADPAAQVSKILFKLKSPDILLLVQLPILILILEKVAQS